MSLFDMRKPFEENIHYFLKWTVLAAVIGGLGGAVAEVLAEKAPTKMLRIGINDVFGESGPAVQLLAKYGIDAEGIYEKVKAFV